MADTPAGLLWSPDEGYRGFDVHIVRGSVEVKSAELKPFVLMSTTGGFEAAIPTSGAGAPTKFEFESNLGPRQDPDTFMPAFGFTFAKDTGQVTVAPAATSRVVRNFIVIAVVTFSDAGPFRLPIRVHVHTSRDDVRLSPDPLHIRKGTALRLSVLALFDDPNLLSNTVGDISYHPGVTFDVVSGDLQIVNDQHPDDPQRGFSDGGFIQAKPSPTSTSGSVRVKLPDYLGPATLPQGQGTANVTLLPGWGELPTPTGGPNPYRAELIGGGPGVAKRADPRVRNVLFLPEGFLDSEQELFKEITETLVTKELRGGTAFRPFDLVSKKINFFRVWIKPHTDIPQDRVQSGITEQEVLNPSFDMDGNVGKTRGHFIPIPIEPTMPLTPVTKPTKKNLDRVLDEQLLPRLLFRVGLPVAGTSKDTFAAQLAEWNRIYGSGFVTFDTSVTDAIKEKLFRKWVVLGQQVMTLDLDTVFGMSSFGRPRVAGDSQRRVLKFHPFRYTRDDLDAYVSKIEALDSSGNVVTIGNDLWVQSAKIVGSTVIPNKDLRLLVFICRGQRRQGTNASSGLPALLEEGVSESRVYITVSTADNQFPLLENSNRALAKTKTQDFQHFGGDLIFPVFPVATLAHEMAHTMFCGDEYGPSLAPPSSNDLASLKTFWNLQDPKELNDPTLPLNVSLLRWRWPRAAAAGFMASPLNRLGTSKDFTVDMEPGQSDKFAQNNLVRFRPPELLSAPAGGGPLRFVQPTSLFKFLTRDTTNRNRLILEIQPPEQPVADAFAANNQSALGMILYKVRFDDPTQPDKTVESFIIPQKMLDHLQTNGVLTRKPQTACVPATNTSSDPQIPVHVPPELKARNQAPLIGLFDGGSLHRCGIVHATGFCAMRRSANLDSHGNAMATPYCHVCRYIIVDRLDPSGHFDIDKDLQMPGFKL